MGTVPTSAAQPNQINEDMSSQAPTELPHERRLRRSDLHALGDHGSAI